MDLRSFNVPSNIAQTLHEHNGRGVMWYQPFIFSDQVVTGTGAIWNGGQTKYFCNAEDTPATREVFLTQARVLGDWYDTLVKMSLACAPEARTFLDVGCNVGHFGFALTKAGRSVTGVDRTDLHHRVVRDIVGTSFEFIPEPYSERSHDIPALRGRQFDFTVASAVSTHLTDPHYFLGYLGETTRQGVLLTTPLRQGEGLAFKARLPVWSRDKRLPFNMELVPTAELAEVLLTLAGFPYLYRRPFREGDPANTSAWGAWVALRSPAPAEAVSAFGLEARPNLVEQHADIVVPGNPMMSWPKTWS